MVSCNIQDFSLRELVSLKKTCYYQRRPTCLVVRWPLTSVFIAIAPLILLLPLHHNARNTPTVANAHEQLSNWARTLASTFPANYHLVGLALLSVYSGKPTYCMSREPINIAALPSLTLCVHRSLDLGLCLAPKSMTFMVFVLLWVY